MTDQNQNATKHGAAGAIKRITNGQPFIGVALDQQHDVEARLETHGLEAIVQENAIRLQAALDLYYAAVLGAAQAGDTLAFDSYIARYGWLAGVTLRAWAQVKQDRKQNNNKLVEVLDHYKQAPTMHQEAPGDTQ